MTSAGSERVLILAPQGRDAEVDGLCQRLEQISLEHVTAIRDTVELGVLAGELDRGRARIGRPHLHVRAVDRERDRDGAAAGADVRDPHRHSVDSLQCLVDEPLR